MLYRVFGGLAFIALGAGAIGIAVPGIITALLCLIAGVTLLAGK
jgi:hypothetical protein